MIKNRGLVLAIAGLIALVTGISLTGCAVRTEAQGQIPSSIDVNMNNQQKGIWVSGQGKVPATPDTAILTLGVSAQATSVAQAQSQAAAAMDQVKNALTGNGVAEKDIQTQNFSIQQVTRYDKDKQEEVVIGYQVSNMVVAKIRTIEKAGAIIDAVAAAGGDLTRINGMSFTVDNPKAYYDQAREQAMNDAKAKAEQIARLAGVTLGLPTYISDVSYQVPSPLPVYSRVDSAAGSAPTTSISPGQMDITLTVQVAYVIQ